MNFIKQSLPMCSSLRRYATLRERNGPKISPEELYEPKFETKKLFPDYEKDICIRLQGYDYVPLEKYQSYIHKIARRFKYIVADSYAVAAKTEKVKTFKPNSSIVGAVLNPLITYDRWLKLQNVTCVHFPIFLILIQTHLPVGVNLTVKEFEKSDETLRYIPDLLLKEKQDELKSLDDINIRKMLGWE